MVLLNIFIKGCLGSTNPQVDGTTMIYIGCKLLLHTKGIFLDTERKKVQVLLPTSSSIYTELATESSKMKITSIMQCMILRHQKKCSFSFMLHFHNGKFKEH